MKPLFTLLLLSLSLGAAAQKIDSIYFDLYTDSLKKGVYNYISVDGKLATGSFYPLMESEVTFSSSAGKWAGNSLILDKDARIDSVIVTAVLKQNPVIRKSVTIWVKKFDKEPVLKTEQELLDEWRRNARRKP